MKKSLIVLLLLSGLVAQADKTLPAGLGQEAKLGFGFNTDTDLPAGECLTGAIEEAGVSNSSIDFTQDISREELSKELNFDAGGRAKIGAGDVSASAKFFRSTVSSSFSLVSIYTASYAFKNQILSQPTLTTKGNELLQNQTRFAKTCGDSYVAQIQKGAKIFFSIRIDFASEEDKSLFESAFSYQSSFSSAYASLKHGSRKFSSRTSVKVSAYQLGGDIEKLSALFGNSGTGANGDRMAFVQCSFGDFSKCDGVLARALEYATDVDKGFPSQLRKVEKKIMKSVVDGKEIQKEVETVVDKTVDLTYVVKPYENAGIYSPYPTVLNPAINLERKRLETLFFHNLEFLDKARLLRDTGSVPLSARQMKLLDNAKQILNRNSDKLIAAIKSCYDYPMECLSQSRGLDQPPPDGLSIVDNSVIDIQPESFVQYCALSKTTSSDINLTNSIGGILSALKELDAARFKDSGIDDCVMADLVIRDNTVLNLPKRKISTILPLAEYVHLIELNLADNEIRDLSPLTKMNHLEILNLANNRVNSVENIAALPSLRVLNLNHNNIRNLTPLQSVTSLEKLFIKNMNPAASCPKMEGLRSCTVNSFDGAVNIAQVAGINRYNLQGALFPENDLSSDNQLTAFNVKTGNNIFGALLYDFSTGLSSFIRTVSNFRFGGSAIAMPKGAVVVSGGWGEMSNYDVYQPLRPNDLSKSFSLAQSRAFHTSHVLDDKHVILIGGYSRTSIFDTTEVNYLAEIIEVGGDRSRTVTLPMFQGRAMHTSTVLPNGDILVVGGLSARGANTSIEQYNAATRKFTPWRKSLKLGRGGHSATLLKDGRVVIVGGIDSNNKAIDSIEILNPKDQSVTMLYETLTEARGFHGATLVGDSNVLIAGGKSELGVYRDDLDYCNNCSDTVEIINVAEESVEAVDQRLSQPRSSFRLKKVGDKQFYLMGGESVSEGRTMDLISIQ